MKILSIISEKGGTGKTTLALNIAGWLYRKKKRVLLIDADPRAQLTSLLHINLDGKKILSDYVLGMVDELQMIKRKNISIVAGDSRMNDIGNSNIKSAYQRLKSTLNKVANDYDYAIIDTASVPGNMRNVFVFLADDILIPTLPSTIDINQTRRLLCDLREKSWLLAHTTPHVVFNEMTGKQSDITNFEIAREQFGAELMTTQIRANDCLRKATEKGMPVVYAKRAAVSKMDFSNLINELFDSI